MTPLLLGVVEGWLAEVLSGLEKELPNKLTLALLFRADSFSIAFTLDLPASLLSCSNKEGGFGNKPLNEPFAKEPEGFSSLAGASGVGAPLNNPGCAPGADPPKRLATGLLGKRLVC